jgi:hypothetical protein
VPISSFYGRDPEDTALVTMMKVLDILAEVPDVRPVLEQMYRIRAQIHGEPKAESASNSKL